MAFNLALLLQGDTSSINLISIGVAIVLCLIVLGLRFFRAMFEVLTAPQASLGYHGRNDGFMHSLMIVLLGGLVGTLVLFTQMDKLKAGLGAFAETLASTVAAGATNKNYADVIKNTALTTVNNNIDNFVISNLWLLPLVIVVLWIFVSFLAFIFAKMLGGSVTMPSMAGALAYAYFFWAIAYGLNAAASASSLSMAIPGNPGMTAMPSLGVLGIIGAVLSLYALILFIMGVSQGGDLTTGATIGVLVFLIVIIGGIEFALYYNAGKTLATWISTSQAYNPATGGSH